MSTQRGKRGKPKQLQVRVNNPSEVRAWARYWRCSQQDVRDGVKTSGAMPADVQDWLKVNVVR
jgi:hypothetical protein